jgi:hypothetical protein
VGGTARAEPQLAVVIFRSGCPDPADPTPGSPGGSVGSEVFRKGGKPHGGWRDFLVKFVPDSDV